MNHYSYICTDDNGQEKHGFLQAKNDESARINLMEQGLRIVRLDLCSGEEIPQPDTNAVSENIASSNHQLSEYGKTAWNPDTEFLDHLPKISQLNVHGMPLSASMRTLAEETTSRKLSHTFQRIAIDLEQGTTTEESFSRHLKHVPQNLESLIRAGAQTEQLESIIENYIESQRLLVQSRHKVMTSLFYSCVLVLGTFSLFYFLMVSVVTNFQSIFIDFGIELPTITILTISISNFLSSYGLSALAILLFSFAGIWFSFDLFKMQAIRRRLINHIPILGNILNYTSIALFCRMLATIIEAKIKLPEAIELAAKTTKDPNLIAGCVLLKQRTREGFDLLEASIEIPHFSQNFVPIFQWQDRPDIFVDSLRASSNIFQAKANMKTGVLVFTLQPLVLIGIIVSIGLPIVAIYLPLIKLLNDLS
ncbi:type II secretion system F family protein [Gimesia fumaroli]|uniref:Type II secretion system protein F n=1 Tax=Gimesia fumaroli TaxID=2527976 RepID=A0A518IL71_9PLAN|nr:type II secretion system F family protein [Gimesia fumaroli]QDV53842.1 Type II secretion system protein F [Gimesia fumaroli]